MYVVEHEGRRIECQDESEAKAALRTLKRAAEKAAAELAAKRDRAQRESHRNYVMLVNGACGAVDRGWSNHWLCARQGDLADWADRLLDRAWRQDAENSQAGFVVGQGMDGPGERRVFDCRPTAVIENCAGVTLAMRLFGSEGSSWVSIGVSDGVLAWEILPDRIAVLVEAALDALVTKDTQPA